MSYTPPSIWTSYPSFIDAIIPTFKCSFIHTRRAKSDYHLIYLFNNINTKHETHVGKWVFKFTAWKRKSYLYTVVVFQRGMNCIWVIDVITMTRDHNKNYIYIHLYLYTQRSQHIYYGLNYGCVFYGLWTSPNASFYPAIHCIGQHTYTIVYNNYYYLVYNYSIKLSFSTMKSRNNIDRNDNIDEKLCHMVVARVFIEILKNFVYMFFVASYHSSSIVYLQQYQWH